MKMDQELYTYIKQFIFKLADDEYCDMEKRNAYAGIVNEAKLLKIDMENGKVAEGRYMTNPIRKEDLV